MSYVSPQLHKVATLVVAVFHELSVLQFSNSDNNSNNSDSASQPAIDSLFKYKVIRSRRLFRLVVTYRCINIHGRYVKLEVFPTVLSTADLNGMINVKSAV